MTGKLIYVFSEDDAKKLAEAGYPLLNESDTSSGHIYTFVNDGTANFSLDALDIGIISDTLTL